MTEGLNRQRDVASKDTPPSRTPESTGILANFSLEQLDELAYKSVAVGFPLLTIGIITGAIWAESAWGSYWSWDPIETWALITWFVFLIYLHAKNAELERFSCRLYPPRLDSFRPSARFLA